MAIFSASEGLIHTDRTEQDSGHWISGEVGHGGVYLGSI